MRTFTDFIAQDMSAEEITESTNKQIDDIIKECFADIANRYTKGEVDDDAMIQEATTSFKDAMNAYIIEQALLAEISAAASGRAAEHEYAAQHDAVAKQTPAKPAAPSKPAPKKAAFTVMHHDGAGWKVSHHDNIHSAAKQFATHVGQKVKKVKIVDHTGKVVHANHEAVAEDMSQFISD